jgi:hypothetical protein
MIEASFTTLKICVLFRCSCYGNDNACKIVKDNYTCSCLSSSNTIGPHCDGCGTGYYRSAEQFVCNNPCKCNMTGSNDIVCEEVTIFINHIISIGPFRIRIQTIVRIQRPDTEFRSNIRLETKHVHK